MGEIQFSLVQSCPTLWNPMDSSMSVFPVYHPPHSLLKLLSIKSVIPSNHLILCHLLLLLLSIFPSIRVFSSESLLCIRWPKYWSFSSSISPSNEYSGLISFRIDWFDFLAIQGTFKSLLQHHSSKASILWWSAFFMVQLSHPCMTTGKNIALTRWGHGGEFFLNLIHWRMEWQATSVLLPWEPHQQYEKAKRYDTERWTFQVNRFPKCYWRRVEK